MTFIYQDGGEKENSVLFEGSITGKWSGLQDLGVRMGINLNLELASSVTMDNFPNLARNHISYM